MTSGKTEITNRIKGEAMSIELAKVPTKHLVALKLHFSEAARYHHEVGKKCEVTANKLAEECQNRATAQSMRKARKSNKR